MNTPPPCESSDSHARTNSPDPRRTSLYDTVLQTAVGLLMARGTVTPEDVRESLQLDSCLCAVFCDMKKAGAVELPPAHAKQDRVRLATEPAQLVAVWDRLRSAVAVQREAA